ncbi:MAG: hypothetical protein V7785_21005 [Bermanella sp.]
MKITELSLLGLFMISLLTGCGSESDSDNDPVVIPVDVPEDSSSGGAVVSATGDTPTSANPDEDLVIPDIDPGSILPGPEPLSILKGSWQLACTEDEDGSSQNGNIVYSQDSLHFFASYYSDSTCQNLKFRIEMSGQYALGDTTVLDSGAVVTYLSQDITSFQVAYYDSDVIFSLNREAICDSSTWSAGELKEIRGCSNFDLDYESFKKDIVSVENNRMVSGDFDFIGEDGYPTQLDDEILIKQSSTELEGEWLQDCRIEDQSSYRRKLEFIGNSISLELGGYNDSSCENVIYNQRATYSFILGDDQILASGESVTEMVNSMFSAHMAFYGEDIISEVNSNSLLACGVTSWKDAVYKDVFECDWTLKPASNDFKEVVRITDNELTFGDDEYIGGDGFATQLQAESYIRQ